MREHRATPPCGDALASFDENTSQAGIVRAHDARSMEKNER